MNAKIEMSPGSKKYRKNLKILSEFGWVDTGHMMKVEGKKI